MFDTLSETQACDLLTGLFKSRGYAIRRNVLFREYGVEFHVDGWDSKARVGFEFLTSEDEDHDDLSLEEYKTLSAAQLRGELSLFILDEVEPLSAADLAESANAFLDEVALARTTTRRSSPARRKASASKKPAVRKKAVALAKPRTATKKTAGKKGTTRRRPEPLKKSATKKPAAKKSSKKVARKKPPRKAAAGKKARGRK